MRTGFAVIRVRIRVSPLEQRSRRQVSEVYRRRDERPLQRETEGPVSRNGLLSPELADHDDQKGHESDRVRERQPDTREARVAAGVEQKRRRDDEHDAHVRAIARRRNGPLY